MSVSKSLQALEWKGLLPFGDDLAVNEEWLSNLGLKTLPLSRAEETALRAAWVSLPGPPPQRVGLESEVLIARYLPKYQAVQNSKTAAATQHQRRLLSRLDGHSQAIFFPFRNLVAVGVAEASLREVLELFQLSPDRGTSDMLPLFQVILRSWHLETGSDPMNLTLLPFLQMLAWLAAQLKDAFLFLPTSVPPEVVYLPWVAQMLSVRGYSFLTADGDPGRSYLHSFFRFVEDSVEDAALDITPYIQTAEVVLDRLIAQKQLESCRGFFRELFSGLASREGISREKMITFLTAVTEHIEARTGEKWELSITPAAPAPAAIPSKPCSNIPAGPVLANGWPALEIPPGSEVVIPGVSSNRIGNKYRVLKRLSGGSFGTVYLGANVETKEQVAIKVENRNTRYPMLLDEYKSYQAVSGPGIPKTYWCGSNNKVNILVMQLMDKDLHDYMTCLQRKLTVPEMCKVAVEIITALETLHKAGIIHRDLKSENIAFSPAGEAYLIDFGLTQEYLIKLSTKSIQRPMRTGLGIVGTIPYISMNVHAGYSQAPRDDLESLGYVLLELLVNLPWRGLPKAASRQAKDDQIAKLKLAAPETDFGLGAANAIAQQYIPSCRRISYYQTPEYEKYREWFRALAASGTT